jgi:23S rRNA pseudouridine2605 synthase
VVLADGFRTAPMQVIVESNEGKGAWLRVVMHEGRKHEIREIGLCLGLPVVRIVRRRIGGLPLGSLRPGQWRELTGSELTRLAAPSTGSPPAKIRRPTRPVRSARKSRKPSLDHGKTTPRRGKTAAQRPARISRRNTKRG